eukprot:7996051-Heterocapsa_arctica.AAC.1
MVGVPGGPRLGAGGRAGIALAARRGHPVAALRLHPRRGAPVRVVSGELRQAHGLAHNGGNVPHGSGLPPGLAEFHAELR